MATFNEILESFKQNRSNALASKASVENVKTQIQDDDQSYNEFLWGAGADIGVQQLIKLYYEELNIETSRTWNAPSLGNYTKTVWDQQLNDAVRVQGDREGSAPTYPDSIYPDTGNGGGQSGDGVADDVINTSSPWLNKNGDQGQTAGGLFPYFDSVDVAIGNTASDNSNNRTSSYSYSTSSAATTAGQNRALADRGTTLKGRRSQNADEDDGSPEITTQQNGTGGDWRYIVGANGVDHPDYFNNPERSDLLNAITNLINVLDSSSAYQSKLDDIYTEVDKIKEGNNPIFETASMSGDIVDDRPTITTLKSDLDTYVGTSGDAPGTSTLWAFYNYFNQFSASTDISGQPGYVRSTFDSNLTSLESFLSTGEGYISSRYSSIYPNYVGNNTTELLYNWRYFWITTRIEKPESTLVSINGIDAAINNSQKAINNATTKLVTLGLPTSEYIPTPEVASVFQNDKVDIEGAVTQKRIGVVVIGAQHTQEYEIYRRPVSQTPLNNDPWNDTPYDVHDTIDPNSGFVSNIYNDLGEFEVGDSFVYRTKCIDGSTSSLESNIFGASVSFTEINNGVIEFSDANHGLIAGSYAVITGITGVSGFYFIQTVLEDIILISPGITTEESGSIAQTSSVIFITQ